jgi:hypothetical protein
MEISLFFILPLISGFIFVCEYRAMRVWSERAETQRLYYYAAAWGTGFFVVGLFLHDLLITYSSTYKGFMGWLYANQLLPLLERPQSQGATPLSPQATTVRADLLVFCCWALLIGMLTPAWNVITRFLDYLYVRLFKKSNPAHSFLRWLNLRAVTDEIELLLVNAVVTQQPVQATLSNGKVYVGKVIESRDPSSKLETFRLIPMMSGYRDKDTGEVEYTTFYQNIFTALKGNGVGIRSFELVIPIDKIVTISGFDLTAYRSFQENRQLQTPAPEKPQQTVVSGDLKIELVRTKPASPAAPKA